MKLIVGLGNPGRKYEKTRHNIGCVVINKYVSGQDSNWQEKIKFKSQICQIGDVIFAKPTTFMNLSGEAVQAIASFYKISIEDILVISDDIDLDFGKVRVRQGGSDGGHNGLKSIVEHIGSDFWRLRIGVASDLRQKMEASDFVLKNFSKTKLESISKQIKEITSYIDKFIDQEIKPESASTN